MAGGRSKLRAGKRGYQINVMLSAEEAERLDALAAALGWSRSAVIRHAVSRMEDPEERQLMEAREPPGNRREIE